MVKNEKYKGLQSKSKHSLVDEIELLNAIIAEQQEKIDKYGNGASYIPPVMPGEKVAVIKNGTAVIGTVKSAVADAEHKWLIVSPDTDLNGQSVSCDYTDFGVTLFRLGV